MTPWQVFEIVKGGVSPMIYWGEAPSYGEAVAIAVQYAQARANLVGLDVHELCYIRVGEGEVKLLGPDQIDLSSREHQ